MTREEAIKTVGLELVEEAERDNCDTDLGGLEWEIDHYEIIG